jgi:hypothetical protein
LASTVAATVPPLPTCYGAQDLLVAQSDVTVAQGSYGEICVTHHGILHLGTVRVGVLYVDSTSTITADGVPGGTMAATDCAPSGTHSPDADGGGDIAITARRAVIAGTITANGGDGLAAGDNCDAGEIDPPYGGSGGGGGSITLTAGILILDGRIEARGGNGGTEASLVHPGGVGGQIRIATAVPPVPDLRAHLSVAPGLASDARTRATAGSVLLDSLTAAEHAALPPAPPLLTQIAGTTPTILPVQPDRTFSKEMRCATHDLEIPAGTTIKLGGLRRYRHACVDGVLRVQGELTLLAQTVRIGPTGAIRADGVALHAADTPRCAPTRSAPQGGATGETATSTENVSGFSNAGGSGGMGGGVVLIVARRMAVAGRVTADGARGGDGADDVPGSPSAGDIPPSMGGGGGSGGSITLMARDLQITGLLSARGGQGGLDGADPGLEVPRSAQHGVPGCIRLFATTLRAAAGRLALPEPLVYGKLLPTDPVPPPAAAKGWYAASTMHTLAAPFLAFWQHHGGMAIFGAPLSEPFTEGGQTVQYFERARLVRQGTQVQISPIGRLLTAGHPFPPAAPVLSTAGRRYFPTTKHTLAGRFLTFWQQHHGSLLFGPPISEPLKELQEGTDATYLVQYFANARLEYHPEIANPRFQVALGRLGYEYLHRRGLA